MPRRSLPFDPIERAAAIWSRRFDDPAGTAVPAMAAVTSVMRAQQLLLATLDSLLKRYDLTFARYEALVLLSFSRTGYLPLRVMGERLMVHPTSVTNIVDRLSKQGLVDLRPNPEDGRGKLAEITSAGREVVQRATADLMAADFGLAGYPAEELDRLYKLLRPLRLAAGDFAAGPEPARPEFAGPEPARPEFAGPEPARPELAGPEPAGPEPAGPEPAGPEPAGPEPAGPEPAGPEPAGAGSVPAVTEPDSASS